MAADDSKRIVFLCSGGGGNLAFIHLAIQRSWLQGAVIIGVLTDRACIANAFSERLGIYNRVVDIENNRQEGLLFELETLNPDIVITTIHKIIGAEIVSRYQDKLINLHYSLLPAFSGLIGTKTVRAALEDSVLFGGVTVHQVNEKVDAGRPLVQGAIALQPNETVESLMPVVFRCGCIALLKALNAEIHHTELLSSATILNVLGHVCIFNGGGPVSISFVNDDAFWNQLQELLQ